MNLSIVILLILIKYVSSHSMGAPNTVCDSMTPGHTGVSSQACSSNYTIQSDKSQYYSNETVRITISGATSSDTFRGLLLIAKTETSQQIIGTWQIVNSTTQTLACGGTSNTGITHSSNVAKTLVQAIWTPPSTAATERTMIKATIVKAYNTIYVNCFSLVLTNREVVSTSTTTSATTVATTAATTTTTAATTIPTANITWTYTNGVTSVKMQINNLQTSQWFALGLSLDDEMGEDHVFVCKRLSNDTVISDRLINAGGYVAPVLPTSVLSDPGGTFTPTLQKLENGVSYCEFTLSNFDNSGRRRRAISGLSQSTAYYPLIAIGDLDNSNAITTEHTIRTALPSTVQLNRTETVLFGVSSETSTTTVQTTTDSSATVEWTYANGVTSVKMQINTLAAGQWFALGLSLDRDMGEDHVFVCKRAADGTVTLDRLINAGGYVAPVSPALALSNPGGTVTTTVQKLENGVTYCEFTLSNFDSSRRRRRAISGLSQTAAYYPLIAIGNLDSSNAITTRHTERSALSQTVQLNRNEKITYGGSSSPRIGLMKAHGIMMIFAWILFVPTAILLARYFKPSFPEKKLCGKAIWFSIHRAVMISVVVLTIIAFILILVYKKGKWVSQDSQREFAHSILGIITICFAIIQPIMALFRCHPDGEYRFVFNYAHRFVGTSALILSIITIFLAMFFTQFTFEENKQWGILVAWTCWLPVIFVLFWAVDYYFQRYKKNSKNMDSYNLGNGSDSKDEHTKQNQIRQDRIKSILLIIHILIALGLSIALTSVIGININ